MSHMDMRYWVEQEPRILHQVIDRFGENERLLQAHPHNFDTIVIFATGSSSNAAHSAKPFMSSLLDVNVEIKEPSMALHYEKGYRDKTLYFAISQGGHSASTLKMVQFLQQRYPVLAITSDPESPLARQAKEMLLLEAEEDMPFVSAGVAAIVIFLWMIALALAKQQNKIDAEQAAVYVRDIRRVIDLIPQAIARSDDWFLQVKDSLYDKSRFLCVSYGSCYGSAREFETKFTETVRVPSAGFELEEFMHGPYLGIQQSDTVFLFDPCGKLSDRQQRLAEFLCAHIDQVIYVSDIALPLSDLAWGEQVREDFSCILYNVLIHIVCWNLSQHKHIDLTRSSYPDFDVKMKSKL